MYDVGTDVKNAGKSKKMLKIVDRILKKHSHHAHTVWTQIMRRNKKCSKEMQGCDPFVETEPGFISV